MCYLCGVLPPQRTIFLSNEMLSYILSLGGGGGAFSALPLSMGHVYMKWRFIVPYAVPFVHIVHAEFFVDVRVVLNESFLLEKCL